MVLGGKFSKRDSAPVGDIRYGPTTNVFKHVGNGTMENAITKNEILNIVSALGLETEGREVSISEAERLLEHVQSAGNWLAQRPREASGMSRLSFRAFLYGSTDNGLIHFAWDLINRSQFSEDWEDNHHLWVTSGTAPSLWLRYSFHDGQPTRGWSWSITSGTDNRSVSSLLDELIDHKSRAPDPIEHSNRRALGDAGVGSRDMIEMIEMGRCRCGCEQSQHSKDGKCRGCDDCKMYRRGYV